MILMRGVRVDGPFFRDTLSENQNWKKQMRGVRVDGPFFRDTLSENQNWILQMRGARADGPFSEIHCQKIKTG